MPAQKIITRKPIPIRHQSRPALIARLEKADEYRDPDRIQPVSQRKLERALDRVEDVTEDIEVALQEVRNWTRTDPVAALQSAKELKKLQRKLERAIKRYQAL